MTSGPPPAEITGMTTDTPEPAEPEQHIRALATVIRIDGKTIWQFIGAVVATLVVVWALDQARSLVAMAVFSLFLSLAMQPAVNALHDRFRMRRGAAVGLIYVGGFLILLVMVLILIPMIARLAEAIGENGTVWLTDLSDWLSETFGITLTSPEQAARVTSELANSLKAWVGDIVGAAAGLAAAGINLVFWIATVAMFTFYFTAQAPQLRDAVLSLFSPDLQQRLGWTYDRAVQETGGYFYSRLILMAINGTGFFFTMVVVGVPTQPAVALALIGSFIAAFIPAVGTYIGSAIPTLVTLAFQGLVPALIILAYAIVYQQIENYVLSPRISANTMTLNGGLAFGAALFGGAVAGPLGAFMALPVTALVAAFISQYAKRSDVVYVSSYYDGPASGSTG